MIYFQSPFTRFSLIQASMYHMDSHHPSRQTSLFHVAFSPPHHQVIRLKKIYTQKWVKFSIIFLFWVMHVSTTKDRDFLKAWSGSWWQSIVLLNKNVKALKCCSTKDARIQTVFKQPQRYNCIPSLMMCMFNQNVKALRCCNT